MKRHFCLRSIRGHNAVHNPGTMPQNALENIVSDDDHRVRYLELRLQWPANKRFRLTRHGVGYEERSQACSYSANTLGTLGHRAGQRRRSGARHSWVSLPLPNLPPPIRCLPERMSCRGMPRSSTHLPAHQLTDPGGDLAFPER